MISIIVSSYKPDLFESFSKNVEATIGDCPFEVIQIWNPGLMGICEAYNKGAAKAKFQYLVFAHEDILFNTNNWGEILVKTFCSDDTIGLIGCYGNKYKNYLLGGGRVPSRHFIHKDEHRQFFNGTLNGVNYQQNNDSAVSVSNNPTIVVEDVAVLDGMFLCTRSEIFERKKFDAHLLKSFHGYDYDYSLALKTLDYRVVVSHNILIEHSSYGNYGKEYFNAYKLFHKKWKKQLPIHVMPGLSKDRVSELELNYCSIVIKRYKYKPKMLFRFLKELFEWHFIRALGGWINWCKFLIRLLGSLIKQISRR